MGIEIKRRRQILLDSIAKVVTNTELTDLNQGGVLRQILDACAVAIDEIYYQEQQQKFT